MKKVTNMLESLPWHTAWLIFIMMRAGWLSREPKERNIEWVTDMISADPTPLPLASPMQKNNLSSRRK